MPWSWPRWGLGIRNDSDGFGMLSVSVLRCFKMFYDVLWLFLSNAGCVNHMRSSAKRFFFSTTTWRPPGFILTDSTSIAVLRDRSFKFAVQGGQAFSRSRSRRNFGVLTSGTCLHMVTGCPTLLRKPIASQSFTENLPVQGLIDYIVDEHHEPEPEDSSSDPASIAMTQ